MINRRTLFTSIAGLFSAGAAKANQNPVRHLRLNYKEKFFPKGVTAPYETFNNAHEPGSTKVLVNGRHIHAVWYVDTEAGIISTYYVVPGGARANGPKDGFKRYCSADMSPGLGRVEIRDVTRFIPWEECMYSPADFPGREVDCTPGEAMTETLRGHVQVVDAKTGELLYGTPGLDPRMTLAGKFSPSR